MTDDVASAINQIGDFVLSDGTIVDREELRLYCTDVLRLSYVDLANKIGSLEIKSESFTSVGGATIYSCSISDLLRDLAEAI